MQRREWLHYLAAAGVGVPALMAARDARPQSGSGKILVQIFAPGGLDQSSWTDPRNDKVLNEYAQPGLVLPRAGNIRYAPMSNNKTLFETFGRDMLVINGVDSETNDHRAGVSVTATGSLGAGFPTMAEAYAASRPPQPFAWMNDSGTYSTPVGMVSPTPIPDEAGFRAMVAPNSPISGSELVAGADLTRLQAAEQKRLEWMKQSARYGLPRNARMIDQFLAQPQSRAVLQRIAALTPAALDRAHPAAHMGLICAAAGVTNSIHLLSPSHFDGHAVHTALHNLSLGVLASLVTFVWNQAEALGIAKNVFMCIYTEFGRTALNNVGGKDHWQLGSWVLMERGAAWGNRVFGASGPKHEPVKINLATAKPDDAAGTVITARHVNAAMRRYLGLEAVTSRFPLGASALPDLFNPNISTGYPTL